MGEPDPSHKCCLAGCHSSWQADQIEYRVEALHSFLETPYQGTVPYVVYFHCEGGIDRTGEMAATYSMKYLNLTLQEAIVEGDSISHALAGRNFGSYNQIACAWYCYFLGLDNCTLPDLSAETPDVTAATSAGSSSSSSFSTKTVQPPQVVSVHTSSRVLALATTSSSSSSSSSSSPSSSSSSSSPSSSSSSSSPSSSSSSSSAQLSSSYSEASCWNCSQSVSNVLGSIAKFAAGGGYLNATQMLSSCTGVCIAFNKTNNTSSFPFCMDICEQAAGDDPLVLMQMAANLPMPQSICSKMGLCAYTSASCDVLKSSVAIQNISLPQYVEGGDLFNATISLRATSNISEVSTLILQLGTFFDFITTTTHLLTYPTSSPEATSTLDITYTFNTSLATYAPNMYDVRATLLCGMPPMMSTSDIADTFFLPQYLMLM
eukprot:TRINITY_DN6837_c0_g3_i1.p1 TRINITY_DN6837_c0_g3~~TRINITY_DN6837_c0_g3_i1.p1  ORF type:complete len:432 (-),score=147.25 TRINITY_DN6837_c0_g3_i1:65-1360(-)